MSYDPSKVAFVDTETTGLDPEHHPIWEIAVIVDDVEHVWQQRLPHWRMWTPETYPMMTPWVLENTGIIERYDDDEALSALDSMAHLESLVRGRHLIGACPWFDSERLHRVQLAESDHRDLLWHYHLIDVENLAVGYIRGMRHGFEQIRDHGYPAEFLDNDFDETALPWSSTELSKALGVDPAGFEPKHSALADARWAKAMFEAMMGDPDRTEGS